MSEHHPFSKLTENFTPERRRKDRRDEARTAGRDAVA